MSLESMFYELIFGSCSTSIDHCDASQRAIAMLNNISRPLRYKKIFSCAEIVSQAINFFEKKKKKCMPIQAELSEDR